MIQIPSTACSHMQEITFLLRDMHAFPNEKHFVSQNEGQVYVWIALCLRTGYYSIKCLAMKRKFVQYFLGCIAMIT